MKRGRPAPPAPVNATSDALNARGFKEVDKRLTHEMISHLIWTS